MTSTTRVPASWKALTIVGVMGLIGITSSGFDTRPALAFDGDDISSTRELDNFHTIVINGAMELNVKAGKSQSVEVITRDSHQKYIEMTVEDGVLTIDMDENRKSRKWSDFWNDVDVDVNISLETLKKLEIKGAIDGAIENLNTETFELDLRGAADLDIEGSCQSALLDIRGAGDISAKKFECETVEVNVRGAGSASVFASEAVDANVSGVGSIAVYGKPQDVKKFVGGIGSINIKD